MAEPASPGEMTAAVARRRRLELRWQKVMSSKGDVFSRKLIPFHPHGSGGGPAQEPPPPGQPLQQWKSGIPLGTSGAWPGEEAPVALPRSSSADAARSTFLRSSSHSSSTSANSVSSATINALAASALKAKFRRPQFRRMPGKKGKGGKGSKTPSEASQSDSLNSEDDTSDDVASEASSSGTSSSSDEDAMDAVVTAATSLLREEMSLGMDTEKPASGPTSGSFPVIPGGDSTSAPAGAGSTQGSVRNSVPSECAWPQAQDGVPGDHFPSNGMLSVCGRRREMEDAVTLAPAFATVPCHSAIGCWGVEQAIQGRTLDQVPVGKCQMHMFAVFDGHGGSQAALFCAAHLHGALEEEVKVTLDEASSRDDPSAAPADFSQQWTKAFTTAFARIDAEISGHCFTRRSSCNLSGECGHQPLAEETVGTTAVVSVVTQRHIIVANCGDSRAVLCRKGQAIPLSKDHKPDREDEMKRIEKAGGRVVFWNGYRVLGVLAMSRAIGDRYLKPYVIPEPEVTFTERSDDDECLILASDGLWDVINNETACDLARKCLTTSTPEEVDAQATAGGASVNLAGSIPGKEETPASLAAAVLTRLALARGSSDNTSVVVVDLRKPSQAVLA